MKILKTFLSLTLIITMFSLNSCSGVDTNSPSDVVETSFKLLKNKEYDKLSKLYVTGDGERLSEDEIKKVEGLLGMAYDENQKKDGVKNITIDNEEIMEGGTTAKVKYTITYGNGKTNTETAKLYNIDGDWYLSI